MITTGLIMFTKHSVGLWSENVILIFFSFLLCLRVFLLFNEQRRCGFVLLTKALIREAAEMFWLSFMSLGCLATALSTEPQYFF